MPNSFQLELSGDNMMGYVPRYYLGSRIYKAQAYAKGAEFDILQEIAMETPDQASPYTATWGLAFWEKLAGLPVNPGETLESRRARVLEAFCAGELITPFNMRKAIRLAFGIETEITRNVAPYTFRVNISGDGDAQVDWGKIADLLERKKEAHTAYQMAIKHESCIVTSVVCISWAFFVPECGTLPWCGTWPYPAYPGVGHKPGVETDPDKSGGAFSVPECGTLPYGSVVGEQLADPAIGTGAASGGGAFAVGETGDLSCGTRPTPAQQGAAADAASTVGVKKKTGTVRVAFCGQKYCGEGR